MDKTKIINKLKKHTQEIVLTKDMISVIIPYYRNFDLGRVLLVVESIYQQKGIKLEVVIAEENSRPTLEGKLDRHTKYVFSYRKELKGENFFRPGFVRNIATINSRGEFLYNNDGDIVFKDTHYLTNLIKKMEEAEDICLYHPLMRRLPLENFKDFKERFDKGGIQRAVNDLDLSQPYGATYSDNFVMIRHFKKNINGELEISVAHRVKL